METKIYKGKDMATFARTSTCTFDADSEKEIWLCKLCQVHFYPTYTAENFRSQLPLPGRGWLIMMRTKV